MATDKKFVNGLITGLVIAALFVSFYVGYRVHKCPPTGQILLSQAVWDSIKALADKPPTVHIDTAWVEKPVVIPDPQPPLPDPQVVSPDTVEYADSLVNKEINVWYDFKVKGTLLERTWSYKPITLIIKEVDSIPYPEIEEKPVPYVDYKNGLYIYGLAGGNAKAFLFGAGVDYISKKNTEFGYLYQRYGKENFHSLKVGVKFRILGFPR